MEAFSLFDSALGRCGVAFGPLGLLALALPGHLESVTAQGVLRASRRTRGVGALPLEQQDVPSGKVARWVGLLQAHLDGCAVELEAIELDFRRLSPFRTAVYERARRIPRAQLSTYGQLAEDIGSPRAARAVGQAMAENPWPICVPCHRVVSAVGELGGFSAPGGAKTKARLLALEGLSVSGAPTPSADPRQISLFEISLKGA